MPCKKYAVKMNAEMSESQQFEVMTQMISELRDGHVNLYTTFNTGRYWSWKEDYPTNLSDTLLRRYLRTDYLIAGGTDYTILDDNIGYLRYESFQQGMSDANLDQVMLHMAGCNGLIIDVRGNGGGLMTHAERLAARCNAETTVGYLRHKTGTRPPGLLVDAGAEDPPRQGTTLAEGGGGAHQPRSILCRQRVCEVHELLPHVTIVGDRREEVRECLSRQSCPTAGAYASRPARCTTANGAPTEEGIAPDYYVSLSDEDFRRGRDTLIEWARKWLSEGGKGARERVRQR